MARLLAFMQATLNGYFASPDGTIDWAHRDGDDNADWHAFVASNASSGGRLIFGRVTYEMMAGYWPTPMAASQNPLVAKHMNALPKTVFSRTLTSVTWQNATVARGPLVDEVRRMKEAGEDIAILGSSSVVAQLASAGLIDLFQVVINPVALGAGRTLLAGVSEPLALRHTETRTFRNGNVLLAYRPA